jgi:hypothetical protein
MNPLLDEPTLTQAEKDLRDHFVNEYTLDSNAKDACMRMGYNFQAADMMVKVFMQDAYVKQRIAEETSDANKQHQRRTEWCRRQLVDIVHDKQNNASARVSAIKVFAEMHGITKDSSVSNLDDAIKITRLIINEKNAANNSNR